jgi:hypothetical protein
MTKQFFLKLFLLLFSVSGLLGKLSAQSNIEYLNINNVNAGIAIGGNLFTLLDSLSYGGKFESPKGGGRTPVFTQALWLTALDGNYDLHCAGQRYYDYGYDYFDGPIASTYDSAYNYYYKRVWKVTQQQLTQFRALSFPTTPNLVDSSILFWPGKGNPSVMNNYAVNISSNLAPFVDLNSNGIYEPLLGDYPAVCGDEGVFFVFNDARGAHTQTNGLALGVEIRGIANSFVDTTSPVAYAKRAINNTIFVQYEIENKSTTNYTAFDVANWLDPDVGCFNNDRVGCDSARNLMFAYNGVGFDPDCAPELGYGALPIAFGAKLLNQPMTVFGYFTGQGASAPALSDPITAQQYRNYSEGLWGDGSHFTYGGNGYGGAVADSTKLLIPGDPNDTLQWSEVTAGIPPGDRRMFSTTSSSTFNAGEIKHFDYAFFTSFDPTDTSSTYLRIVDTLKRDADILQSFYNSTIVPCQHQIALAINEVPGNNPFAVSVYPNPTHSQLTIEADNDIQSIELTDVIGRVIIKKITEAKTITLPVSQLSKGVYLVTIESSGNTVVKKIVVE